MRITGHTYFFSRTKEFSMYTDISVDDKLSDL